MLRAVGDRQATTLDLGLVRRKAGCRFPALLRDVHVVGSGRALGAHPRLRVVKGKARLALPPLPRHGRVSVRGLAGAAPVLGRTVVLRRPDLALRLLGPATARAGLPFGVHVEVSERGRDLGATALLAVGPDGAAATTQSVRVAAGRTLRLDVPITIAAAGTIAGALRAIAPRDGDPSNDNATLTVALVDFQVEPTPTVANVAGFGAQLNQNVYAALNADAVTPANVGQMESNVVALQPQLVRIFFNKAAFTDSDRLQSFVRTVQLAQRAGATIDVTWQSTYGPDPEGDIARFAGVLADLVRSRGVSSLRWASAQNEVNGTKISMDLYARMVRSLDAALRTAGLREQIKIMGGDLVGSASPSGQTQGEWLAFLGGELGDVVDAVGVHMYWDYWDTAKLERRLSEVRTLVDALPQDERKLLYVTEYGVRGHKSPTNVGGVFDDGTPFQPSNVHAFQVAWFNVLAARLGYLGTIKWDAFVAKYDNTAQDYSLMGSAAEAWPLRPAYRLLQLFTATAHRGWSAVAVDVPPDARLMTAFRGPAGEVSVIGLDRDGAQLNSASTTTATYVVGGLPPGRAFHLLLWNALGDGATADGGTLTADATGVVTITAPLQAVFALSG